MSPTTVVMAGLGAALAVSVTGNLWLFDSWQDAEADAVRATEQRDQANTAAKACSDGVGKLRDAGEAQHKAAMAAIEQARIEARKAYGAADAERNRPQAVPGDACASADVETREWLERRRAGNGR